MLNRYPRHAAVPEALRRVGPHERPILHERVATISHDEHHQCRRVRRCCLSILHRRQGWKTWRSLRVQCLCYRGHDHPGRVYTHRVFDRRSSGTGYVSRPGSQICSVLTWYRLRCGPDLLLRPSLCRRLCTSALSRRSGQHVPVLPGPRSAPWSDCRLLHERPFRHRRISHSYGSPVRVPSHPCAWVTVVRSRVASLASVKGKDRRCSQISGAPQRSRECGQDRGRPC